MCGDGRNRHPGVWKEEGKRIKVLLVQHRGKEKGMGAVVVLVVAVVVRDVALSEWELRVMKKRSVKRKKGLGRMKGLSKVCMNEERTGWSAPVDAG